MLGYSQVLITLCILCFGALSANSQCEEVYRAGNAGMPVTSFNPKDWEIETSGTGTVIKAGARGLSTYNSIGSYADATRKTIDKIKPQTMWKATSAAVESSGLFTIHYDGHPIGHCTIRLREDYHRGQDSLVQALNSIAWVNQRPQVVAGPSRRRSRSPSPTGSHQRMRKVRRDVY